MLTASRQVREITCFDRCASVTPTVSRTTEKQTASAVFSSPQIRNRSGAWMRSSNLASVTGDCLHAGAEDEARPPGAHNPRL